MYNDRKMKLGIHTYTLHLSGLGQNWGFVGDHFKQAMTLEQLMDNAVKWGLDGIHLTNVDLGSFEPARLASVRKAAKDHGLYLELNCALNEEFDPRINHTFTSAVPVAEAIGADLIKFGLDIRRPKPLDGSCFNPQVMRQLCDVVDQIKAALPEYERTGIKLAIEQHTETFAAEIIWVIEQVNHPLVGACVDTINSLSVLESPDYAVKKLAPYAFCCHFCDNELVRDQHGAHFIGVPLGNGDIDCKRMLQILKDDAPKDFDRITFEVEWSVGNDTIEVAREKQLQACIDSITYLRNTLGIGVRKI